MNGLFLFVINVFFAYLNLTKPYPKPVMKNLAVLLCHFFWLTADPRSVIFCNHSLHSLILWTDYHEKNNTLYLYKHFFGYYKENLIHKLPVHFMH